MVNVTPISEGLGNLLRINHIIPRIVPKHGMPPTIEELSAFVSKSLAQYKVPEKWIFVKSLPRNPVGKIDRRKLHESTHHYVDSSRK